MFLSCNSLDKHSCWSGAELPWEDLHMVPTSRKRLQAFSALMVPGDPLRVLVIQLVFFWFEVIKSQPSLLSETNMILTRAMKLGESK